MNVYLRHAGLIKIRRYMRKLRPMLPEKERVFLHLNTEKRITLIEQILLVFFSPNIRKVYLSIPASKVMPHLKWFAFRKDYFKLQTISEIPDDEKWIEEIYYSAVQMPSQNCHYTACLGRTL